ncbi:MAG: hypothetical protein L0H59_13590, partial [Tomitella sp.]|nr:hypothetical protein [Tomitella sp.]
LRATLDAGQVANVRATGTVNSTASASAGTYADGTAGVALGISISNANIRTEINGDITARAEPGYTVTLQFDPTVGEGEIGYVDPDANSIYVGPIALFTGDAVKYSNRRGNSVGGTGLTGSLTDGKTYYVINVEDDPDTTFDESHTIKLAGNELAAYRGDAVDLFNDPSDETQPAAVNSKSFDDDAVDLTTDEISVVSPSFSGDSAASFSLFANTLQYGQAVRFDVVDGDQIGGLEDGAVYYVITARDEQNLTGDRRSLGNLVQNIRLAETGGEADAGKYIDLTSLGRGEYTLTAFHVLDAGLTTGLGVKSSLDATNSATAKSGLAPPGSPVFKKEVPNGFDSLLGKLLGRFTDVAGSGGLPTAASLEVAGALTFVYADHDVETLVNPSAVLRSNHDLEVSSAIAEHLTMKTESSVSPPPLEEGQSTPSEGTGVSVAVAVGIVNNTATTTVDGADLDALRAIKILSGVTYPYKKRPDELIPSTLGEFVDSLKSEGATAVTRYLNVAGLVASLFNVWTRSTATGDQNGIAGSVTVLVLTNDAITTVKGGAQLNQDVAWRDPALNPHPNNDPDNDGNPDNDASRNVNEQTVLVAASTAIQLLTITGVFNWAAALGALSSTEITLDPSLSINPTNGTSGERGGIGGSVAIFVINNTTKAVIEAGTAIYTGADGGFRHKATEAILLITLVQSGGGAGAAYAVNGSFAYVGITSTVLAQIHDGVTITGRDLSMYAGSLMSTVTWAGSVTAANGVGIGVSGSVNDISRTVRAVVGETFTDDDTLGSLPDGSPPPDPDPLPLGVNVTGNVVIRAQTDGQIWAFAVAGTMAGADSPAKKQPEDPLDGVSLPILFGDVAPARGPPKTGLGIAGAVGINIVDDTTLAYLTAATVHAGDLTVKADNATWLLSITGGATLALPSSDGPSKSNSLA